MAWFTANWFWILTFIAFIAMHMFGHGGHGGHGSHGGHGGGDRKSTADAGENGVAKSRIPGQSPVGHRH